MLAWVDTPHTILAHMPHHVAIPASLASVGSMDRRLIVYRTGKVRGISRVVVNRRRWGDTKADLFPYPRPPAHDCAQTFHCCPNCWVLISQLPTAVLFRANHQLRVRRSGVVAAAAVAVAVVVVGERCGC